MASVHRETIIQAPARQVWAALADVGALHTRLVPGFVADCVLDGRVRTVTFGTGMTARETILDVDDTRMRVAWLAEAEGLEHYNASAQVMDAGGDACRVVWIADLLPDAAAPGIAGIIEQGLAAMKRHQEQTHAAG
jgi:ligand-binding SRPBCC domain-containing protein